MKKNKKNIKEKKKIEPIKKTRNNNLDQIDL
jgi:hypothetical protein